jgi:2-haloacid dehalogenase
MAESLLLSKFDAVTFDFYGTIVDWEPDFLRRWTQGQGCSIADNTLLEIYDRLRQPIQAQRPAWLYPEVLKRTLDAMVLEFDCILPEMLRVEFGDIAASHRAFPDSLETLKGLKQRSLVL